MVQAAWLEKGKKRWALAVMSDENATRSYGWDTQKGVTGLLLGQEPTPAYLAACCNCRGRGVSGVAPGGLPVHDDVSSPGSRSPPQ